MSDKNSVRTCFGRFQTCSSIHLPAADHAGFMIDSYCKFMTVHRENAVDAPVISLSPMGAQK
jgi:hypothetical protein